MTSKRLPPWALVAIALGALVFALYGRSLSHRLTLDAVSRVAEDPRVTGFDPAAILEGGYWAGAGAGDEGGPPGLYRPLTTLWLAALNTVPAGPGAAAATPTLLNLGNLLLHAGGVVLRFLLVLRLLKGRPRALAMAAVAGVLFAVHPSATEAVCTQVGASEGLVAVFATASLLALIRALDGGGPLFIAGSVVAAFLAMAAKENALLLPAVAFLLAWLGLGRRLGPSLLAALPATLALGLFWTFRAAMLGTWSPAVQDPVFAGFDLAAQVGSALAAFATYTVPALLWPFQLLPVVTHEMVRPAGGLLDPRAIVGLALVVLLVVLFGYAFRKDRVAALGIALFLVLLFPVSNLVVPIGAIAATRFLYLPLTGLGLAIAAALTGLADRPAWLRRGAAGAVAVWLAASAVATYREVPVWADDATLFATAAERSGGDAWSLGNLGNRLQEAGRIDAAIEAWEGAARIEMPVVPGTDRVPEDVLEMHFKATMNAALGHVTKLQRSAAGVPRSVAAKELDAASALAAAASELAARGAAQAARGPSATAWTPLRADALLLRARIVIQLARLEKTPDERQARVLEADPFLASVRALEPGRPRADLVDIEMRSLAGDTAGADERLLQLYERFRGRAAADPDAVEVAATYGQWLLARGRRADGLAVLLEAMLETTRPFDPLELFARGREAWSVPGASPELRRLAARALERFLAVGPRGAGRERAEALSILDQARRGG